MECHSFSPPSANTSTLAVNLGGSTGLADSNTRPQEIRGTRDAIDLDGSRILIMMSNGKFNKGGPTRLPYLLYLYLDALRDAFERLPRPIVAINIAIIVFASGIRTHYRDMTGAADETIS